MILQGKLKQCQQEGKALLATNFYNFETLKAILLAAAKAEAPVLLQLTRSSIEYMGLKESVALARAAISESGVEGWLHLDHGDSIELVKRCLDEGFDSVMIDASEKEFIENVQISSQVVEIAKSYNANVEAELGYVAKLDQEQQGGNFTTPEEASSFVRQTGVNALAIAIGSAHGFYKSEPELDIERLKEIRNATDVALVLHGSSGIPHNVLRNAIKNGIVKVNLATEIKNIFMSSLKTTLLDSNEIDLRKVFPKAIDSVVELLIEKYRVVNLS